MNNQKRTNDKGPEQTGQQTRNIDNNMEMRSSTLQ